MDNIFRSQFRLPIKLHEQLKTLADEHGNSLNAELVYQLESAMRHPQAAKAKERRKSELIREFIRWCTKNDKDPSSDGVVVEFCTLYNHLSDISNIDDLSENFKNNPNIEHIPTIDNIDPKYLSELYFIWCIQLPRELGHSSVTKPLETALYTAKILAPELKSMSNEISFQVVSKLLEAGLFQSKKP